MRIIKSIQNRIYEIRGERVMLDRDLAALYEIEVKVLNQAVKRQAKRFPKDFMFQLTNQESDELQFQVETVEDGNSLRSQIVTLKNGRGQHRKYLPNVFTEQGVAMLSGILNSDKAIAMNIAIMRAFVEMRKLAHSSKKIAEQIQKLIDRVGEHDTQLAGIYDAIENLLDKKVEERNGRKDKGLGLRSKALSLKGTLTIKSLINFGET